jgi:hypothetical protein
LRVGLQLAAENQPIGDGPVLIPEGSSYVTVSGWAVDADAEDEAGGVYISIDGNPLLAFYGLETEAVAERLGNPAYESSGFKRSIPVSEIGSGRHKLSISVLTSDGERYRSSRELTLEVS